MLGKRPAIQRGVPNGLLRVGREEGSKADMIQDLELNASTVVITIVVLILFVLALRVAVRSWTAIAIRIIAAAPIRKQCFSFVSKSGSLLKKMRSALFR